ncbi:MAG: hypothetical protein ACI392_02755 [Paludibacteraceae bacterium]
MLTNVDVKYYKIVILLSSAWHGANNQSERFLLWEIARFVVISRFYGN